MKKGFIKKLRESIFKKDPIIKAIVELQSKYDLKDAVDGGIVELSLNSYGLLLERKIKGIRSLILFSSLYGENLTNIRMSRLIQALLIGFASNIQLPIVELIKKEKSLPVYWIFLSDYSVKLKGRKYIHLNNHRINAGFTNERLHILHVGRVFYLGNVINKDKLNKHFDELFNSKSTNEYFPYKKRKEYSK